MCYNGTSNASISCSIPSPFNTSSLEILAYCCICSFVQYLSLKETDAWTKAKKEHIFRSRVEGTRWIVKAIQGSPDPPKVLVCASAIGIYGDRGDEELTERRPVGAGEFLAEVSQAWEAAAQEATTAGTRVVSVRIDRSIITTESDQSTHSAL